MFYEHSGFNIYGKGKFNQERGECEKQAASDKLMQPLNQSFMLFMKRSMLSIVSERSLWALKRASL